LPQKFPEGRRTGFFGTVWDEIRELWEYLKKEEKIFEKTIDKRGKLRIIIIVR
jgi:hypothetical protein